MPGQSVTILYFAWLRERTGMPHETIDLPEGVTTIGGLMTLLGARSPSHETAFANPRLVRAAVNQDFATPDTPIADGDEIAFFPPVTGG